MIDENKVEENAEEKTLNGGDEKFRPTLDLGTPLALLKETKDHELDTMIFEYALGSRRQGKLVVEIRPDQNYPAITVEPRK